MLTSMHSQAFSALRGRSKKTGCAVFSDGDNSEDEDQDLDDNIQISKPAASANKTLPTNHQLPLTLPPSKARIVQKKSSSIELSERTSSKIKISHFRPQFHDDDTFIPPDNTLDDDYTLTTSLLASPIISPPSRKLPTKIVSSSAASDSGCASTSKAAFKFSAKVDVPFHCPHVRCHDQVLANLPATLLTMFRDCAKLIYDNGLGAKGLSLTNLKICMELKIAREKDHARCCALSSGYHLVDISSLPDRVIAMQAELDLFMLNGEARQEAFVWTNLVEDLSGEHNLKKLNSGKSVPFAVIEAAQPG